MPSPVPDIAYDYEHFTFDKLDRILPVAQTHQIGEMDFTLLAIECYAAGFVATTVIEQDWRVPDPLPPRDDVGLPQMFRGMLFITDVVDDLGNRYGTHMRAGTGGGGGEGPLSSHVVYNFAPALAPAAHTLTFALTQVERPRYDAAGRPTWRDNQVVAGPWTMSCSLAASPEDNTAVVAVLPVADRIVTSDISATVTTIERYPWGFVVNSRFDWPGSEGPFPHPAWRATDDHGRSYGTGNCAGGGDDGGDGINTWRMNCRFQPEIDSTASELTLRLRSHQTRHAVRLERGDRFDHWETEREAADLGEIKVTLPTTGQDLT